MKKLALEVLNKIAFDMDRKGKYSEADKIEEMMKSMRERVGLADLISLADSFDAAGEHETANRVDEVVKIAAIPIKDRYELMKVIVSLFEDIYDLQESNQEQLDLGGRYSDYDELVREDLRAREEKINEKTMLIDSLVDYAKKENILDKSDLDLIEEKSRWHR